MQPILYDKDRRVRVLSNGTPVVASTLQSQYAKYLNFIGFTVTENPVLNTYDITGAASTDEKVAVYSNGTQVGTVARKLNFSTDFTVTEDSINNRFTAALAAPTGTILLPDGTTTTKPKVGTFYGGSNGGNGLFSGITLNGTPTTELGTTDLYSVYTSAGSDADLAGFSTPNFITRRDYNPVLKCRFKNNVSTEKMFFGFLSNVAHPINQSAPLDGLSGAAAGWDDGDAKIVCWWNNGAATAQKTLSTLNKDTAVHTVTITLDNTLAKTTINIDGTNVVSSTTTPPAATTSLAVHNNAEAVGSTATPYGIAYCYLIQNV